MGLNREIIFACRNVLCTYGFLGLCGTDLWAWWLNSLEIYYKGKPYLPLSCTLRR